MVTIKEFRERRKAADVKPGDLESNFRILFNQWLDLNTKLTFGERAAYSNEAIAYRKLIGIERANEIMDIISDERLIAAQQAMD